MSNELTTLSEALARAGLNGGKFAREINLRLLARGMSDRVIHSSTPYHWIREGWMPHDPLPSIAAGVLAEYLGTPVKVSDLWPQHRRSSSFKRTAILGLTGLATVEDMFRALDDLVALGAGVADPVDPVDGFDLLGAVNEGYGVAEAWRRKPERERVLPPQVNLIAAHVAALRKQDDQLGGGVLSLRYVINELRGVLDLVQYADYEPAVGHRLMTIVSDLAQLVGWMQFDAGRYGAAQRYLLLSDRVARSVDEMGRAANAIGMLAYVSAFAGHGDRAIQIAWMAEKMGTTDPILQARITGRVATAAAAAGDLALFRSATEKAKQRLCEHRNNGVPSYLYYLEPEQLVAEEGQGLIALAKYATATRTQLLDEAIQLLRPISKVGARTAYPRSALLHGCFLTEAYLLEGQVALAVQAAEAALYRLPEVQSIRGRSFLRRLRLAFAANNRNRYKVVAAFLPSFDEALTRL